MRKAVTNLSRSTLGKGKGSHCLTYRSINKTMIKKFFIVKLDII